MMLSNIYYIKSREKAFDRYLPDDFKELISFLATLDLEENIEDLFKDFVG